MGLAFVFPGQGSQSVGMMKAYEALPSVRETFGEASAALGADLWKLVAEGPADQLNLTVNTQPVMLVAGVALYRAWRAAGGPVPSSLAGHSLGEYSALVVAGAIDFAEAVRLVRLRAEYMQDAVPAGVGAMAAILGLDDDQVRAACAQASRDGEAAEAANFNAPGQVVVAGNKPAVERAIEAAKGKGAKRAMLLPMSVPSHCSLMKPAAERLQAWLASVVIRRPSIPVYQNADVAPAASEDAVKAALVRQLCQPVRWVDTINTLVAGGAEIIVECGPGKVLTGLNKRIAPDVTALTLGDAESFEAALTTVRTRPIQGG
ncbi:MAG TPA: ACP S-malonyltransferase [Burkholderiales bacterium]|jgi:[acyl-carrier-protein] S-malonyltransferase|nr:ACP S-malonyltransferase [Burkholderiales bacterium]